MKKAFVLHLLLAASLLLGMCFNAKPVLSAPIPSESVIPEQDADVLAIQLDLRSKSSYGLNATSWCLASDMNGWDNASSPMLDDGTNGDIIAGDGVFSLGMSIPTPGTYYWKAVECGSWSNTHPAANSWVITGAPMQWVTFTLDTNDYNMNAGMALLPATNIVNVTGDLLPDSYTAVGDFQGWNNNDTATGMDDLGNGFYRLVYTIPAAGSYIGKAVITGTWNGFGTDGRSSDAANINFTTTTDNQDVVFLLDSYSGRMLIQPAASSAGTWCAAGSFNGWLPAQYPLNDNGANGDLLGGDGVFTADVTIPTAGHYEFKVYNCTWDVSFPTTGNSWLNTTADGQVVKVTFDTNNHNADAGLALVPSTNIVHAWDSSNSFTAVGDFQGWINTDPETALGMHGRGLYVLNYPIVAAGSYNFKIVATGSWDAIGLDNRSINANNVPFVTYAAEDIVWFYLDYRTGRVGAFPPPPPPSASHDNEIWWAELGHNSRDTLYRTPGGPVTTGTPVTLRLRAAQGDLTEVKLRLYNDRTNTQTMLPMSVAYSDGTYDWWQVEVPASDVPTVYWYRFVVIDGTDVDYYEDDAARTMGWGQAFDETNDYSYQLTVYAADFTTPDWIKNAVVYQVFPDRFRDGNETNDKPAGTFFYGETGGTVYRSLTTDWNEPICDPRGTDACAGTYSKNFYGGDLQGLIDRLDYLQDLGVTTIYLNPIFESPSNHGYDTTDYMSINPMFGDADTFNALTAELATRDMHLILDGVFNHVSSDSIYFDRYGRYDEVGACESFDSPYRDWFYFIPDDTGNGPCLGDDGTPGGATYESWWGYDSLPKLVSTNPAVRALIWDNEAVPTDTVAGHYMQSADGWRLDVGADVDPGTINDPSNQYWEGFRNTVKTVNPEGYIAGEEWGIANSWLLGGEWDAVMNYQFSSAVLSLWRDEVFTDNDHSAGSSAGELAPLDPEQFDERIQNLFERYNPESVQAMLNLFDSHDTSRVLFMLDHNTDSNDPALYANPDYDWSDAIQRLKGAVAVQMTMPGAPTIYYGDEVGLVGPMAYSGGKWEDDPYNRQPFPWLDESGTPFYTRLQTQDGQDELYDYYATLTYARNTHPALRTGDYRTLMADDNLALYAYGRNLPGEDSAVVLINRSLSDQSVSLDVAGYLPNGAGYGDVFSSATYVVTDGQLQNVMVLANSTLVLVLKDIAQPTPPTPVELSATTNGTTVTLNWTASTGANDYLVYRSYLAGGTYELRGMTSTLTYNDFGQVSGQRVYYKVVARNTTNGLTTTSNEVSALPAYNIDWANLQWPFTITHTIGVTPTVNIYGQVYIAGVTSEPGATPGLLAQVGYGRNESDPRVEPDWIWYDAVFNAQAGNNDEFVGTLLPESTGEFDYVYRYSTDGGASWVYADLDGTGNGYATEQAGSLTVEASGDTTAPSAPVLSIADWGASFIDLEWTPSTDDVSVYAYDLYRSTDGMLYEKISRVLAPATTYHDVDVENVEMYYYFVVALDSSFNRSENSNIVEHMAEPKVVQVTFNITVPAFTPGTVYLSRYINPDGTVGDWNPAATALSQMSPVLWSRTFDILDGTQMEFKFARGSWETVMKGADGNVELPNLSLAVDYGLDGTQTYEYTVLNWRDPLVVSVSPIDAAVDVPTDTTITITWSQAMPADACPSLHALGGSITGTCAYNETTFTHTFTPSASLAGLTLHNAAAAGKTDAGGDVQQVPYNWTFTTEGYLVYLPLVFK